jgi:putative transposase
VKKSKFSEAQIVAALKELDAGAPAATVARKLGVHVNTLRAWKARDERSGAPQATRG